MRLQNGYYLLKSKKQLALIEKNNLGHIFTRGFKVTFMPRKWEENTDFESWDEIIKISKLKYLFLNLII